MQHKKVSGLSGNEIYCLEKVGAKAGQLCIGNSVVAIGVGGGIGAGLSTLAGGEVTEVTNLIKSGRQKSFQRMTDEAKQYGGIGMTGVTFDMINHGGNIEFITTGSTVHGKAETENNVHKFDPNQSFTTSANAQELYCQLDCDFKPLHFVFGNVAYSIGVGGNIAGALKSLARGEVAEYSQIFDQTRHLALNRLIADAKRYGANAVVGIQTTMSPIMGTQEMMMVGTASSHPLLNSYTNEPVTSDMTNEEMWNMVNMGYMPVRLVMGVSVYSLGFKSGVMSFLQSLGGGEISGLTEILYEAREKALARIEAEAVKYGADEVVGVKTKVFDLGGGLVEFMAIGTAVKKMPGAKTHTQQIIPQALIQDRDTYVDASENEGSSTINAGRGDKSSARRMQRGPLGILLFFFFIIFYIIKIFLLNH